MNCFCRNIVLLFFLAVFIAPTWAKTVSLSSLLDEMIDRDIVTRFPEPEFVCLQASSYDRASTSSDQPGWFANADTSQFIRGELVRVQGVEERKECVLMDAEGPGAVVRFWITAPHYKGVFRVYLDNETTPTIEANIGELVGGGLLVDSPLSAERARGRNLYLPIPYQKRCKITVDGMTEQKNLYYQINYRSYARGTQVETFSLDQLDEQKDKVETVKKSLLSAGDVLVDSPTEKPSTVLTIPMDGQPVALVGEIAVPNGASLDQLVLKIDKEGDALVQALRSTVLSIKFDGKETVWAPLGDFFGGGVGINPFKSWYSRIEKDGTLISLWKMPFKKTMEVSLLNFGEEDVKITLKSLWAAPYRWDHRSMYFHADWRQQRNIQTVAGDGTVDWNYITIAGRGVFVGDVLSILNRNPAWWGEGDEKIYVDDEEFPSHFGTGTEDYYGYAWCTPQFFESPFHFQPRAEGPGNYGNTTNGRVRLLDGIPFQRNFRFDMEVWHWAKTKIDYSVVTFWYAFDPSETVDFQTRAEQIEELKQPIFYETPMSLDIPGFKIEKPPTGGKIQVQNMSSYKKGGPWNDNDQLWWTGCKTGNRLELLFDVEKSGQYELVAELTQARDYGIIQFKVWNDGQLKDIGWPVDLYNPDIVATGPIHVGKVDLRAGRHAVVVEIVGKNDKAVPGFMVGIDRLHFMAADPQKVEP